MGHNDLAILIPVLRRPHRVEPLLWSAALATPGARVVFICDDDDFEEHAAIAEATSGPHTARPNGTEAHFGPLTVETFLWGGGYPKKINAGVAITEEPLLLFGADDIDFHLGWFDHATAPIVERGKQVVGLNDLIDRRTLRQGHATHFLVAREYAELPTLDGRPGPLFEGYRHNFCDDEFIQTALRRGVYEYAEDARVAHSHPMAGGEDDDVYRLGRRSFRSDRLVYRSRARLWR